MQESITGGVQHAWTVTLAFLPKFALFLVILLVGYFVAKWIGKLVNNILERVGFDRLVERGGVKKALQKTQFDASDIMCKIVFYTLFLFVLQLAFGVFAPNPISDILSRVILFLPTLLVALLIVVVASAMAKGARELLRVALGNLSYGTFLANLAATTIVTVGVFAALSHLQIAPAIVNGLFYAALAIVAGSAIIAIGGGGIEPMREQWRKALDKAQAETPKLKAEAESAGSQLKEKKEEWKEQVKTTELPATATGRAPEQSSAIPQTPRYQPKERSRP